MWEILQKSEETESELDTPGWEWLRIPSGMRLNDKFSTNLVKGYVAVTSMTEHDWKTPQSNNLSGYPQSIFSISSMLHFLVLSFFQQHAWVCSNIKLPYSHNHTHPLYRPDKKEDFLSDSSNTDKSTLNLWLILVSSSQDLSLNLLKTLFLVGQ